MAAGKMGANDMGPENMGPEKEKCQKCGGSGWIQTGTRRENGRAVPVRIPCECRKKDTKPADKPSNETPNETSDFIGRVVLDAPEKFWGS
jgi:hypothetical protein